MKSIIAQVREEMETFLVAWNLAGDNEVRVVEYSDPKSSKYSFSLRSVSSWWGNTLSFDFMRPNGSIYVKVGSHHVGEENIEWLKERYKSIETKKSHIQKLGPNREKLEYYEYECLFNLDKPSDVYDIMVKIQPLYLKKPILV